MNEKNAIAEYKDTETLFEAIENNDQKSIAGILTLITQAAHQNDMGTDFIFEMLEEKEIFLGDSMKEWVKKLYSTFD